MDVAEQVQISVRWTRSADLRRLAFALRPWLRAGWDARQIIVELWRWGQHLPPADPAAYIIGKLQATTPACPEPAEPLESAPRPSGASPAQSEPPSQTDRDRTRAHVQELRLLLKAAPTRTPQAPPRPLPSWLREPERDFAAYLQQANDQVPTLHRYRAAAHGGDLIVAPPAVAMSAQVAEHVAQAVETQEARLACEAIQRAWQEDAVAQRRTWWQPEPRTVSHPASDTMATLLGVRGPTRPSSASPR